MYVVGEVVCIGLYGVNCLVFNSLLEGLVVGGCVGKVVVVYVVVVGCLCVILLVIWFELISYIVLDCGDL